MHCTTHASFVLFLKTMILVLIVAVQPLLAVPTIQWSREVHERNRGKRMHQETRERSGLRVSHPEPCQSFPVWQAVAWRFSAHWANIGGPSDASP